MPTKSRIGCIKVTDKLATDKFDTVTEVNSV